MLTKEAKEINKWLKENYGTTAEGFSIWRVNWSTDCFEQRFVDKDEFSSSGIYLRHFKGIKEEPKYPFCKDRFILEKISLLREIEIKDIILSDSNSNRYSYECIYVFQTKAFEPLPLNRTVIEWILFFALNNYRTHKNDLEEENKKEFEDKKEQMRQRIGELMQVPHLMDLVG